MRAESLPLVPPGYHEVAPHPALQASVECFWLARGAGDACTVLPDGCVDFLFDATTGRSGARLIGAMTQACTVPSAVARDVVAVRFRPGGAAAFLAAPLHEFTDASVELTQVDARLHDLAERGTETVPAMHRLQQIEAWLLARVPRQADGVHRALTTLTGVAGCVAHAAAACGLSRQQFTRVVKARTGLAPRQLASITRLRRALADRSAAAAAQIALRHGYADQAHLARDVRALAGCTWTELRSRTAP